MLAAGVGQGQGSAGAAPGSIEEALAALTLTLELGAGTVNDVNSRNETTLHGVMYRGGSIALIDFLVERGAKLEGVVNSRGWTPLRIADGVALDGIAFIRYPEAAAHLRALMQRKGCRCRPSSGMARPRAPPQSLRNRSHATRIVGQGGELAYDFREPAGVVCRVPAEQRELFAAMSTSRRARVSAVVVLPQQSFP